MSTTQLASREMVSFRPGAEARTIQSFTTRAAALMESATTMEGGSTGKRWGSIARKLADVVKLAHAELADTIINGDNQ